MSTSEGAGTHINTQMQFQRMFSGNVSSIIRKLLQFQSTYSEYLFTNDLFGKCLVTTKATIFIQLTKYTSQFTSKLPNSDTSIVLPLPPTPTPPPTQLLQQSRPKFQTNTTTLKTQNITKHSNDNQPKLRVFKVAKNNHNF